MNEFQYFPLRGKYSEAVILSYHPKTRQWNVAVGNYSTSGDLKDILREMEDELPQVVDLLPFEVYNDDLMIIDLGDGKYEFQSFALLVDEIGTADEIVHRIANNYLWDSSEIFEGINVEEFKPDTMAAMFYAAFLKGDVHE